MFTIKIKMKKDNNEFKTLNFHGDTVKKSLSAIHSVLKDREEYGKFNPDFDIYKIEIAEKN